MPQFVRCSRCSKDIFPALAAVSTIAFASGLANSRTLPLWIVTGPCWDHKRPLWLRMRAVVDHPAAERATFGPSATERHSFTAFFCISIPNMDVRRTELLDARYSDREGGIINLYVVVRSAGNADLESLLKVPLDESTKGSFDIEREKDSVVGSGSGLVAILIIWLIGDVASRTVGTAVWNYARSKLGAYLNETRSPIAEEAHVRDVVNSLWEDISAPELQKVTELVELDPGQFYFQADIEGDQVLQGEIGIEDGEVVYVMALRYDPNQMPPHTPGDDWREPPGYL